MSAILSTPEIRTTLSSPTMASIDRENVEGMSPSFQKIFYALCIKSK